MQDRMIARAKALLADGTVNRVMGWQKGEFAYDITPAVFHSAEELDRDFVFNDFAASNVSKYLVKESRKEGKILAFLKPCDSYSFAQLMKEHRVLRENVYIIGIPSWGKSDFEKIKARGLSGIKSIKDNGSKLAIYLDRGYAKNETVVFEFTMVQDHMYQIDKWVEGETVYTFTPAWFDDFSVDELVIRWNAEDAGAWQPDCTMEDGYLVFRESLSPGGRFTMTVVYPNDAFGFVPERQADGGGSYDPGGNDPGWNSGDDSLDFLDILGGILGLIFALGFIIVIEV